MSETRRQLLFISDQILEQRGDLDLSGVAEEERLAAADSLMLLQLEECKCGKPGCAATVCPVYGAVQCGCCGECRVACAAELAGGMP